MRTKAGLIRPRRFSPMREGVEVQVDDQSRLWMIEFVAHGAQAMRLHLEGLKLPQEAKLYLKGSGDEVLVLEGAGPFGNGDFWSPMVRGEVVRLETIGPRDGVPPFFVTQVDHVFQTAVESQVQACHLDATCYPDWSTSASSVARLQFNDGQFSYLCTGVLMNNNAADFSQLLLTANHCINTDELAKTLTAMWFYRTDSCNSTSINFGTQTPYARYLAGSANSDATLLELVQPVPNGVLFAGWNAENPPLGESIASVHHPGGSWRRISFGNTLGDLAEKQSFHHVVFTAGMGEPGSSGGPLFNASHQVVGQLWGGNASCTNPSGDVFFGKLSLSYPELHSATGRNYLELGLPDDQYYPNQSRETAGALAGRQYSDLILRYGEPDWFKLSIQDKYQIIINTQLLGWSETDIKLYRNAEAAPVASGRLYGTGQAMLSYVTNGTSADTYYVRMAVPSASRIKYSMNVEIKPPPPIALNGSGVDEYTMTDTVVDFRASVYPNGSVVDYWAEYGTDPALNTFTRTQTVTYPPDPVSTSVNMVIPKVAGFTPATQYYVRAVVTNGLQTLVGPIVPFKTYPTKYTISPLTLDFGEVKLGVTSQKKVVTVTNTGTLPLTMSVDPPFNGFAYPKLCPTIAPGESCDAEITLTPRFVGYIWGGFNFYTNAGITIKNVQLQATGIGGQGTVQVPPFESWTFPTTWVGTKSAPKTYIFLNSGNALLKIKSISASGAYQLAGHDCDVNLAPGAKCNVSLIFGPTTTGWNHGQMTISHDGQDGGTIFYLTNMGTDLTLSLSRPRRPGRTTAGGTAQADTYTMMITPSAELKGTLELTCESGSATVGCDVVPRSINLQSGPVSAQVTINVKNRSRRFTAATQTLLQTLRLRVSVGGSTRAFDLPVQIQR